MSFLAAIVRDAGPRRLQRQVEVEAESEEGPMIPDGQSLMRKEDEMPEEQVQEQALPGRLARQTASVPPTSPQPDEELEPSETMTANASAYSSFEPPAVARMAAEEEPEEEPESAKPNVQRLTSTTIPMKPAVKSTGETAPALARTAAAMNAAADEESFNANTRIVQTKPHDEVALQAWTESEPVQPGPQSDAPAMRDAAPIALKPIEDAPEDDADENLNLQAKAAPARSGPAQPVPAAALPPLIVPAQTGPAEEGAHRQFPGVATARIPATTEPVIADEPQTAIPARPPAVPIAEPRTPGPRMPASPTTPTVETGFSHTAASPPAPRVQPQAEPAEPRVHIGQVDVIIAAPASAPARSDAPAAPAPLSSRRYLRRL